MDLLRQLGRRGRDAAAMIFIVGRTAAAAADTRTLTARRRPRKRLLLGRRMFKIEPKILPSLQKAQDSSTCIVKVGKFTWRFQLILSQAKQCLSEQLKRANNGSMTFYPCDLPKPPHVVN